MSEPSSGNEPGDVNSPIDDPWQDNIDGVGSEPENSQPSSTPTFSPETISLYEERFENGYDIYTDTNYIAWLEQFHPDCLPSLCDMFASVTSLAAHDETLNTPDSSAPGSSGGSIPPTQRSFTSVHSVHSSFCSLHSWIVRRSFTSSIHSIHFGFCSLHSWIVRQSFTTSIPSAHSGFCSLHSWIVRQLFTASIHSIHSAFCSLHSWISSF